MLKKRLMAMLMAGVMATTLTACGGSSSSGGESTASGSGSNACLFYKMCAYFEKKD